MAQRDNKGRFVKGHKLGIGRILSSESKEKMRVARIGFKFSKESRLKLSKSLNGHIVSEETKRKISEKKKGTSFGFKFYKGHKIRNTGRTHFKKGQIPTKEWRENMSKIMKKLYKDGKKKGGFEKGNIPSTLGKPRSDEVKEKISKKVKQRYEEGSKSRFNSGSFKKGQKPWIAGKTHSIEARQKIKLKRAKQICPKKDTKIEIKIQNYLKTLGVDFFTHQYMKEIEHGYQCDILIPVMDLIIEVDGDYWHKYPVGRDIDKIRTKELIEKGFKVLRLWEHEIKVMSLDDFKNKIKEKSQG